MISRLPEQRGHWGLKLAGCGPPAWRVPVSSLCRSEHRAGDLLDKTSDRFSTVVRNLFYVPTVGCPSGALDRGSGLRQRG